ncbi:MAG: hypothetical protein M1812_002174 [Candelaria pacifica]|nr:MAG: hypothetical protein M1812_002174 [Candelaria pacifica]
MPLHLLSSNLAHQDSLRLLLILDFIDNVFVNKARSWSSLQQLRPEPDGSRILLKSTLEKVPVLRSNERPVEGNSFVKQLTTIDQHAGFKHQVSTYSLRCGMAYQLQQQVDSETRKYIMSHKSGSSVWSSYEPVVASVDTASCFWEVEAEAHVSLRPMMTMALNRKPDAPMQVDPELKALYAGHEEIRNTVLIKFDSLRGASDVTDPMAAEWLKTFQQLRHRYDNLLRKKLQEERTLFFKNTDCPQSMMDEEEEEDITMNEDLVKVSLRKELLLKGHFERND